MKIKTDQIRANVAPPLREVVEALARSEGRSISSYVDRVLIEHAARRIVARETNEAA